MTKITTYAVFDIETLQLLHWEGYEWDGPVALLKKGRETVEKNAQLGQDQAIANNAASKQANDRAQSALQLDLGSTTPGSLTPAATAQLASDRENIGRTYNGMRQAAFATLGQRGMGNAPSGFSTATNNAMDTGQASQETGAYREAQKNTEAERNFATNAELGSAATQGSLGVSNLGGSTTAAVDRSKMGSTLGDIGQGISTAAGIAGSVVGMPGIGGATSGIFKGGSPGALWSTLGQNNANIAGMNTYMPGSNLLKPSSVGGY